MARIDVLPSIEIIRGLKGILDFYVWRGLPCVRAWPRWRPARQSDASKASALLFGAIIRAYALLANQALLAYRQEALDQPRTARDLMVTGVYGNLHEASMSDFLDALIICRDSLVALTDLLHALHSIDTDEIVTRVEHSVIPDGAATSAAQTSQLTALQKIDDLQNALESKALDRLLVRGMDQLFSFNQPLRDFQTANLIGNDGYIASGTPPADQIWCVTSLSARDQVSPTTMLLLRVQRAANYYPFHEELRAVGAARRWTLQCEKYLINGDTIRAYFTGGLNGEQCNITLSGYIATLET